MRTLFHHSLTNHILRNAIAVGFAFMLLPLAVYGEQQYADIVVIIDTSGSMKAKESKERIGAFIDWAHTYGLQKDRISFVAMGNGAKLIVPLTDKPQLSFDSIKSQLQYRAKYTDVAAGLENAYYELKTNSRPQAKKIILMFSDAQIDMPKGMWDLENSLRYLQTSLIPAMKRERIRIVSIVPQGLQANFPLLQELANGTNGIYYRGLPNDAIATRQINAQHIDSIPKKETLQLKTKNKTPKATLLSESKAKKELISKSTARGKSDVSKNISKETSVQAHQSSASNSIQYQFRLLAVVLVIGFAAVFIAMFVLYKKTTPKKSTNDELINVLEEVQSLKVYSQRNNDEAKQFLNEENEELDFGEPKENLSVSLVAPFLNYSETEAILSQDKMDEITSKPAFALDTDEDPSLSVSNMETLIGTTPRQTDEK